MKDWQEEKIDCQEKACKASPKKEKEEENCIGWIGLRAIIPWVLKTDSQIEGKDPLKNQKSNLGLKQQRSGQKTLIRPRG